MSKIRVLIVDDSRTMQLIVGAMLSEDSDFVVVGSANSAAQAETFFGKARIDVVSLDVEMPGLSGLDYLRTLSSRAMPVVMVSTQVEPGDPVRAEALRRGAWACFPKSEILKDADGFRGLLKAAARREAIVDGRPSNYLADGMQASA